MKDERIFKRFWNKVKITPKCWVWIASGRGNGYGCLKYEGKVVDAHRMSWFLTHRFWPGQWILHTCDNRACVRPSHLYEGTPKDNYWDMREKGNAYIRPTKYKTAAEKREAHRLKCLRYYYRRGKYLRDIRLGRSSISI